MSHYIITVRDRLTTMESSDQRHQGGFWKGCSHRIPSVTPWSPSLISRDCLGSQCRADALAELRGASA